MNETVLKKTHGRNYSETVSTVRMRILSAHIYTGEALRRLDDLRKEGRNERGDAQAKEGSREKRKDREFPVRMGKGFDARVRYLTIWSSGILLSPEVVITSSSAK